MDILWAPWRMAYIAGDSGPAAPAQDDPPSVPAEQAESAANPQSAIRNPQSSACIFCDKLAAGPASDRANLILLRGAHTFVILNLYPYNAGHLMIVPTRHLADVTQLTTAETAEVMATLQRLVRVLAQVYQPEGYNVGMNLGRVAGAGIADHLHMHLVPRWGGDTNFMPVVGQTKVLPESLAQTWTRLRAALGAAG